MSSIDKHMQDIAAGYDSRVRVCNTSITKGAGGCNGQIKFYIGRECILSINDRYGVINDYEKAQIRDAILNYRRREADVERRRQEEEERRRREEEERRRREEEERRRRAEAERVAAYNTLVASVKFSKRSVESSFSAVTQANGELSRQIQAVNQSLQKAKFDVSGVKARMREIDRKRESSLSSLKNERDKKIERISQFDNVQSNLTTERYRQLQRDLNSVGVLLKSATFDNDEIAKMEQYVRELLVAQDKLYAQLQQLKQEQSSEGASGEIAKVAVSQIEKIDKNSLEQIENALSQLQRVQEQIKKSNDEAAAFRVIDELRNSVSSIQTESKFVPRQQTYRHIDYQKQCSDAEEQLRKLYDALKAKNHTTATQGELEYIERTLQQFSSGLAGKNLLDALNNMTNLVRSIHTDDNLCEDIFRDYDGIKEELARFGVTAENVDAFNYDEQRERLLETLYSKRAENELAQNKEKAEEKRSILAMGLRNAFAEQGLYFVTGRISDKETAEEYVFAIPGVDDAVVKAVVTEDSLHWFVCGTQKEDGTTASAERVLQIMRAFDSSQKPQKILNSLSQALKIQSGRITDATDCNSPDALDKIAANGYFSLAESLISSDGTAVLSGQILRDISNQFAQEAEENKRVYSSGQIAGNTKINKAQDRLAIADARAMKKAMQSLRSSDARPKPARRQSNASRARYMNK